MSPQRLEHGPVARYREIAHILVRHGFGSYLVRLGLGRLAPRGRLTRRRDLIAFTKPQRLRLACEDLGVTFIKLGQILSTRVDLLPADLAAELARLHDAIPPEPFEVVEETIAHELGRPVAEVFAHLDPEPLGSASIGQVHAARLMTGEEVVVKVQRPGVEERVEEDLAILMDMARLAEAHTPWGRVHNLQAVAEEFGETLRGELDYIREGRNAERIAHSFAREPRLRVPAIYWPYTTRRVLTMERIHGIKITDTAALQANGVDLHQLSKDSLHVSFKMVLEDGFYHADPHPGNFLIGENQTIGLVDYGMVGVIDRQTREGLIFLLLAIVDRDIERVVDQLLALGLSSTTCRVDHLRRDIEHVMAPFWGHPSNDIDMCACLDGILRMAYRRRLSIPTGLTLVCKTVMMHEALAKHFDPQFSLVQVVGPFVQRLALQAYLPHHRAQQLLPTILDLGQLVFSLPRRAHRLLTQAERGDLSLVIRIQEMEHALESLNRMANRLTLAIIVAGLAVSLALLLQVYSLEGLQPFVGWLLGVTLLAVVGLAVWVIVAVLRRRRH